MLNIINCVSSIHFDQRHTQFYLFRMGNHLDLPETEEFPGSRLLVVRWGQSWADQDVSITPVLLDTKPLCGLLAIFRQWTIYKQEHMNISFLSILESKTIQNSPRVGVHLCFPQSKIVLFKINTVNFHYPPQQYLVLFTRG